MKDKARQEKYMNKLDVPKSEMKRVMEDYQKYRQSGITDDDIIIGAMKADERQVRKTEEQMMKEYF